MKENFSLPDELLSKISGAGDDLTDQDKETLTALAVMFKQNGMSQEEVNEFFKKQYPMHWVTFTDYINSIWETIKKPQLSGSIH